VVVLVWYRFDARRQWDKEDYTFKKKRREYRKDKKTPLFMTCEKADNGFAYPTDSKCYGCAKEKPVCLSDDIIKLHIPGLLLTAERCIFSTVNFRLIDLNMPASCSKRMTSLHNATLQSGLFVRV
jgi:hypothetical protein